MVQFEVIESFKNTISAYNKKIVQSDENVLELFYHFQYLTTRISKFSNREIVSAYNYFTILLFVETGFEYKQITETDLKQFSSKQNFLRRIMNRF